MIDEQLLAELEDLLRAKPENLTSGDADAIEWLGRALAIIENSGSFQSVTAIGYVRTMQNKIIGGLVRDSAKSDLMVVLSQIRASLRMKTIGPVSTAIGQGMVFNYFDEVRKIISSATKDILFVDPYLEAEFVSRYLPYIPSNVRIRLLASKRLDQLIPAVETFSKQNNISIEVRSTNNIHDRHFFIDGISGFQSGASFKDGAVKAPTGIIQITDAFPAVQKTYEDMWEASRKEFPS